MKPNTFIALSSGILIGTSLAAQALAVETVPVKTLVYLGENRVVWGNLCSGFYCSYGVCFDLKKRDDSPASAKISKRVTWRGTKSDNATGHYCVDSGAMTFLMRVDVFVEPIDSDLYVTYEAFKE